MRLDAEISGQQITVNLDLDEPLRVGPTASVTFKPDVVLLEPDNLTEFQVAVQSDEVAHPTLDLPAGWDMAPTDNGFRLTPKATLQSGITLIRASQQPSSDRTGLRVLTAKIVRPTNARIAYLGGGVDQVGTWLKRLGLDVETPTTLTMEGFTTIVIGIQAFGRRPELIAALPRLHAFVEQGGHLVTLYHRPQDNWNPDTTPPRRIEIGSPSVRWRVCQPDAPIKVLQPEHLLLTTPNLIAPEDWQSWHKERGLYFARSWDDCYHPLLSMSDPGEAPLLGALLSGQIGRGRHTHVALSLAHQLDQLHVGAFRLLANLVQPV